MSRRMKEDIGAVVSWLVILFVLLVGVTLAFSAKYDTLPYRASGALFTVMACGTLGVWFRWCLRTGVRDQAYICDGCAEQLKQAEKGKHRAR